LLLFVLFLAYTNRFPVSGIADMMREQRLSINERSRFAGSFFSSFMTLQFVVILLLTPLYTAGAIAEEKERRTLELFFVTDLSNREIVLGKLASRLAKLFLLLLTGLPVVSLLEILGGVDPNMVIAGFVASAMLMLSVGSLSIFASVAAATVLGATLCSYVATGAFALFCVVPFTMLPLTVNGPMFTSSDWAIQLISLGALCLVHTVFAIAFCRLAIFDLRPYAGKSIERRRRQAEEIARQSAIAWRKPPEALQDRGWGPFPAAETYYRGEVQRPSSGVRKPRPPVGTGALLWKEMYVEPNFGSAGPFQVLVYLWIGLMLVWLGAGLAGPVYNEERHARFQSWVRGLELALGFISFLLIALSAASRVTRERERRTLDCLLTLPHSYGAILFAKWLASILAARGIWWVLLGLWTMGLVSGGLSMCAIPLLLAAFVVYSAFFGMLGLWFSTVYQASLRANLFTLLATLLILAGPGVVFTVSGSPSLVPHSVGEVPWGALLAESGLSPLNTLWTLAFSSADLLDRQNAEMEFARIFAAILGLHVFMAATGYLWLLTRARFRAEK
jgi:ABC-type transport system involved in multi-copper enzyme maturation permease subunit